jgi:hypothetical protein
MKMKDNSVFTLGGAMAVLIGLIRLLTSIGFLLLPAEQRQTAAGPVFLPSYAQGHVLLNSIFWGEALVGVFGLAVVPALAALVRGKGEGWLRWASTLALGGFVVTSVGYLASIARIPGIAKAFVAGDASTKAALAVVWRSNPDLLGFWGYGAIGIWLLVIGVLALGKPGVPKALFYLGILLAVFYILVPISVIYKHDSLQSIIAAAGAIIAAPWYIWAGIVLWRYPDKAP